MSSTESCHCVLRLFVVVVMMFAIAAISGVYIETGIAVIDRAEARIKSECPGHRTGMEAHPWARYVLIVVWPAGSFSALIGHVIPHGSLVCDRFD